VAGFVFHKADLSPEQNNLGGHKNDTRLSQ